MELSTENPAITNNESSSRFETQVNGYTAILTYRRMGKSIVLDHTEVPPELEGRGIGSKLARTAMEFARSEHLVVVPLCPFVSSYLKKHPEYQNLVGENNLKRLLDEK
ncbi:MAG TPA: GNAT family N-acetyltransferase [Terriglobales bacterium]|jgi:hypothetical protein|nr:GNAT family N-acetyltransferase [Terriglobales bacterium]